MQTLTRRNYDGNPLSYFRSHLEDFEQYKNRSQLAKGDKGMYRALIRASQLEEAIPEADEFHVRMGRKGGKGEPFLEEREINKIIIAHQTYNGNATEAARHLPHSSSTIIEHWRKKGLKIRKRGRKKSDLQQKEIIDSYDPYNGNAAEAARHLPHSPPTFRKYWREKGLKIRKRGKKD
jgi:transcriptional regulator with GAF, ATPase, and Fis domain